MRNGWTGGQYSLFRFLFGTYLFAHFAGLVPWGGELFSNRGVIPDGATSPLLHAFPNVLALSDAPAFVTALLVAAACLSVAFAAGIRDRPAALALWYVWACLLGRNPLISNPSIPFVGWLLIAHALLPAAPYGSWAARGRPDPAGRWLMPGPVFAASWILMAVTYSYSGISKLVSLSWQDGTALAYVLENPLARPGFLRGWLLSFPAGLLRAATWAALALELFFAPLALFRRLRPWLWASLLCLHMTLLVLIDFADLTLGMVMLHFFTFDPGWVRRDEAARGTVFFDGNCGLCHGFVRFLLAEDGSNALFRFAPLQGETSRRELPEGDRLDSPSSVVLRTSDGRLLRRSTAVVQMLRGLGGIWRVSAAVIGTLPRALPDRAYDVIANFRRRLFGAPANLCPMIPPGLRGRFEE